MNIYCVEVWCIVLIVILSYRISGSVVCDMCYDERTIEWVLIDLTLELIKRKWMTCKNVVMDDLMKVDDALQNVSNAFCQV